MIKKLQILVLLFLLIKPTNAQPGCDSLVMLLDSSKIDLHQADLLVQLAYKTINFDAKKAITYTNKAYEISEQLNDTLLMAKSLIISGEAYSSLGLISTAFNQLSQSKLFFEYLNDSINLIEANKSLGNLHWFEKDYKNALKFYKDAETLSNRLNANTRMQVIYMNIGISYSKLSILDSARHYLDKAYKIVKAENDLYGQGLVLLNIAGFYDNIEKLDSAIFFYQEALQFKSSISTKLISMIYSSLAQDEAILKHRIAAHTYLDSSWTYSASEQNIYALNNYYKAKFIYDSINGDYKEALQSHIDFKRVNDSLYSKEYFDKIANFNALYELNKKEHEIDRLTVTNELFQLNARKHQFLIIFLIVMCISSIITFLLISKSNREKKVAIKELNRSNSLLKEQQEELSSLNEEILIQREELYIKNKELQRNIEKLQKAQLQIIHSEKLATIGLLASGVAHEINNPLNYISAGLFKLNELNEIKDLPKEASSIYDESYKIIEDGMLRMTRITQTLGNTVHSDKETLVNINELISNILQFTNYKIDNSIEFVKNFGDIPAFKSYPDKLQSIILHLISNAIDAIQVYSAKNGNRFIKITTWLQNTYEQQSLFVSIENSGHHLSSETINKIFDPFFTTKEVGKGTGLGLYLVYTLITELNGKIQVENIENGVDFRIEIPYIYKKKTEEKA